MDGKRKEGNEIMILTFGIEIEGERVSEGEDRVDEKREREREEKRRTKVMKPI